MEGNSRATLLSMINLGSRVSVTLLLDPSNHSLIVDLGFWNQTTVDPPALRMTQLLQDDSSSDDLKRIGDAGLSRWQAVRRAK
ncbi:hypothetical protein PAAG_06861 [Paracoccidioides lutzii Pb01]|uniref:Uncharacterized protein n=1 Tax=Paracoccidioides lutzii (strain ATCC MYA-826 / Pb01) TaxID=502779 RepID=C1H7X0_PARBA|nr:hypothetical protein PAAG_06861 [Paracoccidioides lutzii Pb01]EEH36443.2 hypothetical protein PAAG_06861 [Paracoccidioides lutzii Pb01]